MAKQGLLRTTAGAGQTAASADRRGRRDVSAAGRVAGQLTSATDFAAAESLKRPVATPSAACKHYVFRTTVENDLH